MSTHLNTIEILESGYAANGVEVSFGHDMTPGNGCAQRASVNPTGGEPWGQGPIAPKV